MANYQEYTTRIFLNDAQAQDKIEKLRKNIAQYKKDKDAALSKGGKEGDKAWKEAEKNIRKAESELKKLSTTSQSVNRVLGNLKTSSVRDIKQTISAINKELNSGAVARGTRDWQVLTQQLKRAKTELANIEAESSAHSKKGFFASMRDSLNNNWGAITQFIGGVTMLSLTIRKATQQYAEMEEEMANVRKYTGQTTEEVHEMNEEFKQLNTRTSREELNQLAGAAGRLGITSHDEIMEFVDAADKINVALGEDLGDDAVATIGKLAMAFGEDETMGLRGAMLATGSAVNEMAQNSSASANYLVDFTARLSGVGQVAGMTQSEIIGLGSVMDENMQRDEMASTAISKLITELATDSSKFAKIAGIDVKKFADLVEHDMNGALLTLAKSLQGKGGLMQLAPMFAEMGLDGSRAVGVLTVLANKVDDVRRNQEIATKAYKEGSSVIDEFNVQNNTVQAEIDKNKKKFQDLSIELGEKLLPVVKYTISAGSLLVKTLSLLINFVSKYRVTIVALTSAMFILYAIKMKDVAISKLQVFWNDMVLTSCKKLWKVLVANPYAAVGVAITAVIALLIDLTRKSNELTQTQKSLNKIEDDATEKMAAEADKVKMLHDRIHDTNLETKDRLEAITALKGIVPGYTAMIDKEGKVYNENTDALKKYNEQLKKKYLLEGAKAELTELGKRGAKAVAEQAQAEAVLKALKEEQAKFIKSNAGKMQTSSGANSASYVNAVQGYAASVKAQQEVVDKIVKESEGISAAMKAINDKFGEEIVKGMNKNTEDENTDGGTGTGGGTGNGDGNDDKNKGKREADEKEKELLKQKLIELDALYAKGENSYSQYLEDQTALQLQSIKKRRDIWGDEQSEIKRLNDEELKVLERHNGKIERMREIDVEKARSAREAELHAMFYEEGSDVYMNEDALSEALFRNEIEALDKLLKIKKKYSDAWIQIKAQKEQRENEHTYEQKIHYQEMFAQYKREWGERTNKEEMQIALNGLEELLKQKLISLKEYERMKLLIEGQYSVTNSEKFDENVNKALTMAKGKAGDAANPESDKFGSSLFGNDIENWRNVNKQLALMEEQGVITHAQANAAKAQNDAEYLDTLLSRTQMMYDMINNVVNAAAAYSKACSDLEVKNIEKNYDKQIKAAGNNSARKKKLEEKRDEEIRKAKNKASKKAMKIEIAQAIATSAMSALDAYASVIKALPFPANMTMAPIAAAMALAAGALQIATIKKQHAAEAAGYYKGGFTHGSNYHREAGVVHEGEFVANHQAVNNAAVLPALKLIDAAQRNNTVASLTSADLRRAVGESPAAVTPVINIQSDETLQRDIRETLAGVQDAVSILNAQIKNGIYAYATIDGENGVKKQLDKYNRLMRNK